jgi:hypothetical protein
VSESDKERRYDFCEQMLYRMDEDKDFLGKFVFSDEKTFHVGGLVTRCNVRLWESEEHTVVVENQRESSKLNVFCALSVEKIHELFFFVEKTVPEISYLDMLELFLIPQLQQDTEVADILLQVG